MQFLSIYNDLTINMLLTCSHRSPGYVCYHVSVHDIIVVHTRWCHGQTVHCGWCHSILHNIHIFILCLYVIALCSCFSAVVKTTVAIISLFTVVSGTLQRSHACRWTVFLQWWLHLLGRHLLIYVELSAFNVVLYKTNNGSHNHRMSANCYFLCHITLSF